MKNSYIGIVNRRGLECLFVEDQHTVKFMQRRAALRMIDDATCFWAVIDPSFVVSIQLELDAGNARDALYLLQSFAHEAGRLLPEIPDSVPVFAE